MDTYTLLRYLEKICKCKNVEFDVMPCDYLEKVVITSKRMAIVANLSDSSSLGTHWVLYIINGVNGPIEYYDSYGTPIHEQPSYFLNFCLKNKRRIIQINKQLQSINSEVCGHYCIFFTLMRLNGCSMQKIYSCFSKNYVKNDTFVKKVVEKLKQQKSCKIIYKNQSCKCLNK